LIQLFTFLNGNIDTFFCILSGNYIQHERIESVEILFGAGIEHAPLKYYELHLPFIPCFPRF